jgi:hypothetical protein
MKMQSRDLAVALGNPGNVRRPFPFCSTLVFAPIRGLSRFLLFDISEAVTENGVEIWHDSVPQARRIAG